jgi:hypothetical protein
MSNLFSDDAPIRLTDRISNQSMSTTTDIWSDKTEWLRDGSQSSYEERNIGFQGACLLLS